MTTALLEDTGRFLRQTMLGSEAVYRVLAEDGETVTVEVVRAPGLPCGMHVRLMARACRAMERFEGAAGPITVTRRAAPLAAGPVSASR